MRTKIYMVEIVVQIDHWEDVTVIAVSREQWAEGHSVFSHLMRAAKDRESQEQAKDTGANGRQLADQQSEAAMMMHPTILSSVMRWPWQFCPFWTMPSLLLVIVHLSPALYH
jgi:hypothetical protein